MNQISSERPQHLNAKFDHDLQELKEGVVNMARAVDERVSRAIRAFVERDAAAAAAVVTGDKQINDAERALDERCVLILALLQPVASDLRFVAAVLKIVTDLERIGDFAVSIGKSVAGLDPQPLPGERELVELGQAALGVLRRAVDAFIRRDVAEARDACTADRPVTAALVALASELRRDMRREPLLLDNALAALFVTRYLERVAEHAANIAEMALYTERGEDIRHVSDQTR